MSEIVIVVTGQTGPTFASATTIADAGGYFAATTVEGALQEEAAARVAHIADTVDAHDASAISFAPTGTIGATDVQAAVAEVASESVQASVLTTNGDVLTRAAGVPARITRADLAADSEFSSRYASVSDQVWVGAREFRATFGGPAETSLSSRYSGWLLDSGTQESVGASVTVPSWWNTMHVDMYLTNAGAGAGNAVIHVLRQERADTEDLTAGDMTMFSGAVAAPAQNILKVIRVGTSITLTANDLHGFYVTRLGANVSDTLGNDCTFLGLLLTRAT